MSAPNLIIDTLQSSPPPHSAARLREGGLASPPSPPFDHVQCSKVRPDVPANHPPSVSHSRDGIERKYVRKPIECAH